MTESTSLDLLPIETTAALTLGGFLDEIADRYGPREALVFYDALRAGERASWSYEELRRQSHAVARALIAAGLGKGERVGLLLGNRNEFVAAFFGAALAGALPVTLSTFSTPSELLSLLQLSDITLLLTQRSIANRAIVNDLAALLPGLKGGRVDHLAAPFLRRVVALGCEEDPWVEGWNAFLAAGVQIDDAFLKARAAHVSPNDPGVIIYTSGTTNLPKGVVHLHSTVVKQFRWNGYIYGRKHDARMGSPFPLFWSAGLVSVLGSTLSVGGAYIGEEVFKPEVTLKLIARERIDEWYGFPTHTAALAEHPDWPSADLRSLTRVRGAYEFDGHPNTRPDPNWHHLIAYGMTEGCTLLCSHLSSTPAAIQRQSAGKPLPGVELRIVDLGSGAMLPTGEEGEICVRAPTMMLNYVGMRREDSFDSDGFFHTGDTGFVDAQGYLHWNGRIKHMIKTGGANVAPSEIESAAAALGSLKLCRAIGLPDQRLGELIVLCAVRTEGSHIDEEEVRIALRAHLAAYKVPRRVLFFEIEEFPLTASGKVQDAELRELAATRL
jgi:acyl-CoA synthetase (AMP-forming)/AMP-acid ligase II